MKRNRWYWRRSKNKWPKRDRYGIVHRIMPVRGGAVFLSESGTYEIAQGGAFTSVSVVVPPGEKVSLEFFG